LSYASGIDAFDGFDALVIERYDRSDAVEGKRIHQEDFNQVLGASGNQKYQEYGGKVSLKRIADATNSYAGNEAVSDFARQLVYAILIGNLDMHAKNVSLLHLPNEDTELAPAYDLVPLQHQETDKKMALSVGGEYFHTRIGMDELISEFQSWDYPLFRNADNVKAFITAFAADVKAAIPHMEIHPKAYPGLAENVLGNIERLDKEAD
jgi:serine/threonine-protein kinase HipA